MDTLSDISCAQYREIVFKHPQFYNYFLTATPVQEQGVRSQLLLLAVYAVYVTHV